VIEQRRLAGTEKARQDGNRESISHSSEFDLERWASRG